jgi:hypothetical protein
MQTNDLFTSTCLSLALNRRDAGILESLLAENAVLIHSGENRRIEGKEAILVFFRIWFHTLGVSLEAGISSLNTELARVKIKGKPQICLLVRQNVRGGTKRFLCLCLCRDGMIDSIEFRACKKNTIEELDIFPI